MFTDILKDIISRIDVRKAFMKFLPGIIILAAAIVALKVIWNYYDVKHLERVIEEQKSTIDYVVEIADKEKEKAEVERTTNQASTKDMVEHIEKQQQDKASFDKLKDNIAVIKNKPVIKETPKEKVLVGTTSPKEQFQQSLDDDTKDLQLIQTAILEAYEKAKTMSQTS